MDNQFRKPRGDDDAGSEHTPVKPADDNIIDLYDDFIDPNADKLDPDVEELKKLAQSDALRAYGFLRRNFTRLVNRLEGFKGPLAPKRVKLLKVGLISAVVSLALIRLVPGIYSNLTGERDILGDTESISPDFDTLAPSGGQPADAVFDQEVGVAIFRDDIGGLAATISQQPLPADIKDDPAGVEKLAQSLSDTSSIVRHETNKGLVYIVTSTTDTETALFKHQELLISIRSAGQPDAQSWVDYVNALQ